MSRNYYCEINLHLVWHTKHSLPLLTPEVESLAHRLLKNRIVDTPGAFVHEIGGTETHVHVAVTIPPRLLISDFIGQLKGGTSHDVNQAIALRQEILEWQHAGGAGINHGSSRGSEKARQRASLNIGCGDLDHPS
jgi:REP element-mobilizing transposase RayT